MKTFHKIILGDSRCMKEIEDESVHLVITSPPYWQLKDYGDERQIGYNDTYEEYINNLNLVWSECHRVLHKGCRLCVNIGDQFARSVYYGRYKIIPIRTEIIKFCETIGFDYMGSIIWQKATTCNTTGGATVMGSFPYPRNGIVKLDYEFILIFKKYGKAPSVSKEKKEASKLTLEEWNRYFFGHWNFPGEKQNGHLAMFPEELPRRLIKMFSFIGDVVLDPFLGSGTTSLAAMKLDRNSIGYEINEKYLPIIKTKLGIEQSDLSKEQEFYILRQKEVEVDFQRKIRDLPYVFRDPVKMERKIDPKKLNFGSKIDERTSRCESFYKISQILTPEEMILDNGVRIRLIGVKTIPERREKAIRFLEEKLHGQPVFLRFDEHKYDERDNLMVYLYLRNKTFINMRLIKEGYARADESHQYSMREKFINLERGRNAQGVDT